MKDRVLVVEDSTSYARQMRTTLESQGFEVMLARDGAEALSIVKAIRPAAVVSDVLMPNKGGFELCWEIRQNPALSDVPVILLTGAFGTDENRTFAFEVGADAYLDKRMVPEELGAVLSRTIQSSATNGANGRDILTEESFRSRLPDRLVSLSTREAAAIENEREALADVYEGTVQALVSALDTRATGTKGHSRHVTEYSLALADKLGVGWDVRRELVLGALLSDLGATRVPDRIFAKQGPLSSEERRIVQHHPQLSHGIIKEIESLRDAAHVVLAHHERWDGTGYPHHLRGEEIPLAARIISLADTVDAITSDRPYRTARPFEAALEELQTCRGTQFDPALVETALEITPVEWQAVRERAERPEPARESSVGYL